MFYWKYTGRAFCIGNIQGVQIVLEMYRVCILYWKYTECAGFTANIQGVEVVLETATIDILIATSRISKVNGMWPRVKLQYYT